MNRSGFFSGFLVGFAIILMIAVLYSSTARTDAQARMDETFIAQQALSKDWFLARNVYTNFAADAIFNEITTPVAPTPGTCNAPAPITDYSTSVQSYWSSAATYMKTNFGVDCVAVLNVNLQNQFESTALLFPTVESNQPAYAVLTCTRKVGETTLTLQHPFVFKKKVEFSNPPGSCVVDIRDVLGDPTGTLDVSQTFI